jgi:hypothetical protein
MMSEQQAALADALASCADLSKALQAQAEENRQLRSKMVKLEQRERVLICQIMQEVDRQG